MHLYHMTEELSETYRETANKHRHEYEIHVGDRVLISLRKHDAVCPSSLTFGATICSPICGPQTDSAQCLSTGLS